MSSLVLEIQEAHAQEVHVRDDTLVVELIGGCTVNVPLAWYPRLWYGRREERAHFEILGRGSNIHWLDLDEDLSMAGILAGHRSGESAESLNKWLASRKER